MTNEPAPRMSTLGPGALLDSWRLEASLGMGGMGIVYRATHEKSGLTAALKIIPPSLGHAAELRQRFRREVQTLARIRHPAVVQILQEALDHTPPYFAMELVSGGSLASRIEAAYGGGDASTADSLARTASVGLPSDFLARLTRELGEGLAAAHAERIIHRDIKPSNVLFTEDDHAKLADFGMAKALDLTGLTVANRVMGTLPYMPPETLRGEVADPRTDLYQLGVTLYESATGRRPYSGEALLGVLSGHPLPPPERLINVCPAAGASARWLEPLLVKLMAERREDRFQSAQELLAALAESAPGGRLVSRAVDVTQPSRPMIRPLSRLSKGSSGAPVKPRSRRTTTQLLLTRESLRVAAPALLLFVGSCAGIAWMLNTPAEQFVGDRPLPPRHAGPATPATPLPVLPAVTSPPLPDRPVIVELTDVTLALGRGAPPRELEASGEAALPEGSRLFKEPDFWQVVARGGSHGSRVTSKLTGAIASAGSPRVESLGAPPTLRFGDELTLRESTTFEDEYFPMVRGSAPRRLGFAIGRIALTDVPTPAQILTLVGSCEPPPWLELRLLLETFPANLPSFDSRLEVALRLMAPCLRAVSVGRDLNAGGWNETPERLGELLERVKSIATVISPKIEVLPGSFTLSSSDSPAGLDRYLAVPRIRRAPWFELRVDDASRGWPIGLAQCRRAAAAVGAAAAPWHVAFQRVNRTSTRQASSLRGISPRELEMREVMRAAARAVADSVPRLWFPALRETVQGPLFIDILSVPTTGKVSETEGAGARAFRYVLSRLGEARPVSAVIPAGVQGVALQLPRRRVWLLWAPDGTSRTVELPIATAAALTVRLCPVAAWNQEPIPPVRATLARGGTVRVAVDDGLVAVEELPLQ